VYFGIKFAPVIRRWPQLPVLQLALQTLFDNLIAPSKFTGTVWLTSLFKA
jgi:hypothetical protein